MRSVSTRIDVQRNNAKVCSLQTDGTPTILADRGSEIKMSITAAVLPDPRVNWLTDELRAVLIIDNKEHDCGVFVPTTVVEQVTAFGKQLTVEGYDRSWLVKSTLWLGDDKLAAGTPYITAIRQLLTAAGIVFILETSSDAALPNDRTFDPGTSYLAIINELLAEINYNELWFNPSGFAVLAPATLPTSQQILHNLSESDVRSLLLPDANSTVDIFSAANVFVCICSTPDRDAPLTSVAINDNPSSPLSVPRRGRRIYSYNIVNDIASQENLDAYAARLRSESMQIGQTVGINTALLPDWGVGDVVGLVYGEYTGVYLSAGWQMEFSPGGNMSHTLKRIIYNYE